MFDPRLIRKGADPNDLKRVWCSGNVKLAEQCIADGTPLVTSPFFNNDPGLRKAGLVYDWSEYELQEAVKCKNSILYFADTYVQLLRSDNTYGPIKLRAYQRAYLKMFQENRFLVFLAARQVGKTVTTAIALLWWMIFTPDIRIAILGDKLATAVENIDKMRQIYRRLPFFLKPGLVSSNQHSFAFDSGSYVFAAPCCLSSIVGRTLSCVYFDEAAIPLDSVFRPTFEFAFPTVSALQGSKILLTSSPRGAGVFKEIYQGACKGINQFKAFSVDWWEVDGRDEAWHQQQLAILGERGFAQQYGNEFLSDGSGWLDDNTVEMLEAAAADAKWERFCDNYDNDDIIKKLKLVEAAIIKSKYFDISMTKPMLHLYDMLYLDMHIVKSIDSLKTMPLVFAIDSGEGRLDDFTVVHVYMPEFGDKQKQLLEESMSDVENSVASDYDMHTDSEDGLSDDLFDDIDPDDLDADYLLTNAVRLVQVGHLASNQHCEAMVALFLQLFIRYCCNQELCKVVCELDGCGAKTQKFLAIDIAKNSGLDLETFAMTGPKNSPGVYQRGKNKLFNVNSTEGFFAAGRIVTTYPTTLFEMSKFTEIKPGKWAGYEAHDDEVLTCVNLGAWMQSADFSTYIENVTDTEQETEVDEATPYA